MTDQDIMEQIQYSMIEPPDAGQTWPSALWSKDEVVNYLNQRQDMFLKDTQLQFGIALIDAQSGVGTYDLPDDWITSMRVVWVAQDGSTKELPLSDKWEADYGKPLWTEADGTPLLAYDGGEPITIQLIPAPDEDGTIQLHYVPYGALLTGDGEVVTLPDEFAVSLKYGAMADMLTKVGRANDESRAEYCQQRFRLGEELARMLVGGFK